MLIITNKVVIDLEKQRNMFSKCIEYGMFGVEIIRVNSEVTLAPLHTSSFLLPIFKVDDQMTYSVLPQHAGTI